MHVSISMQGLCRKTFTDDSDLYLMDETHGTAEIPFPIAGIPTSSIPYMVLTARL